MGSVFTCKQNPCCGNIHNCKPPVSFEERRRITMTVLDEIAAERRHQADKGWTPEHDDKHTHGEIIDNAEWGAVPRLIRAPPERPTKARRLLIEAAALIVAEIERRDRETVLRMARAKGATDDR